MVLDGAPRDEPDDEDVEADAWTRSESEPDALCTQGATETGDEEVGGRSHFARSMGFEGMEWAGEISRTLPTPTLDARSLNWARGLCNSFAEPEFTTSLSDASLRMTSGRRWSAAIMLAARSKTVMMLNGMRSAVLWCCGVGCDEECIAVLAVFVVAAPLNGSGAPSAF